MNLLNPAFFLLNLRRDFIEFALVILLFSVFGYFISGPVEMLLSEPAGKTLAFFSLQEVFFTKIKLSFYTGLFLSVPILILKIYRIGFYKKSVANFLRGTVIVVSAIFLFFFGAFICYRYMVPLAIRVLLEFGGDTTLPFISFSDYIDFCVRIIMLLGLCFELPLLILALVKIGVLNSEKLSKMRRYAVLFIAVLSAFITPPDVVSQMVVMGPLVILYELSILFARLYER